MKLFIVQTDIVWGDREANFSKIERLASPAFAANADLILLPEMFSTGFAVEPAGVAEADGGAETLEWMRRLARSTNAAVAGSVAVKDESANGDAKYFNRMFFVKPDGSHAKYDKRHLFSFAGEDKRYTAGTERVVVEWRGWKILLQVCYDLRFPVFSRCRGDYDMILYSANWPTVRRDAWNSLLKARAIENLCYLAASNRTGNDPYTSYSGGSYLLDFKGLPVAKDAGGEEVIVAEADRGALEAFRQKFPALEDGDDFSIKL